MELSLDSPFNARKKDVDDRACASASAASLSAAASLGPSPSATLEEVNMDLSARFAPRLLDSVTAERDDIPV